MGSDEETEDDDDSSEEEDEGGADDDEDADEDNAEIDEYMKMLAEYDQVGGQTFALVRVLL